MRRQYHSRRIDGRSLVWDVHRLVELTRELVVKQVSLSAIAELDEAYWFEATGLATCRAIAGHAKLMQETDLAYPIILSADGRVMDGMHRVCKALIEGRSHVPAVQFLHDPAPDYVDVDIESLPYDEPFYLKQ